MQKTPQSGEEQGIYFYNTSIVNICISGCTRPPQSQSGAIFFHLNDHCVVFKSARQFWKNVTGRYEKYASDHAFGTLLANKLAYLKETKKLSYVGTLNIFFIQYVLLNDPIILTTLKIYLV